MLHNIRFRPDHIAFKISGDHAVIADKRECVGHDLPPIAAIGQRLQIASHAGGKHHFRCHLAVRAKTLALEGLSIFQHEVCRLSHACPSFPAPATSPFVVFSNNI